MVPVDEHHECVWFWNSYFVLLEVKTGLHIFKNVQNGTPTFADRTFADPIFADIECRKIKNIQATNHNTIKANGLSPVCKSRVWKKSHLQISRHVFLFLWQSAKYSILLIKCSHLRMFFPWPTLWRRHKLVLLNQARQNKVADMEISEGFHWCGMVSWTLAGQADRTQPNRPIPVDRQAMWSATAAQSFGLACWKRKRKFN